MSRWRRARAEVRQLPQDADLVECLATVWRACRHLVGHS